MKVNIGRKDLQTVLEWVGLFVNRKASLDLLHHVLIRARGSRLVVAATDLEQSIAAWLTMDVQEEGEVLVEAKPLLEFVKSLPNEEITIETHTSTQKNERGEYEEVTLTVRCGDVESTFPTLLDELPFPKRIRGPHITVRGGQFRDALQRVVFAASKDGRRPALEGVLFHPENRELHLVATDGYRLAHTAVDAIDIPDGLEIPERGWIVPAVTLANVEKILRKQKYDGAIFIQPDFPAEKDGMPYTAFRWAGVSVGVSNPDDRYPDWERVVAPTRENPLRFVADQTAFLRAVKTLKTAAKAGNDRIMVRVNGAVEMSAGAVDVGNRKLRLQARIHKPGAGDEEYVTAFDWRYLEDVLKILKKQQVLVALPSRPGSPARITAVDHDGFEYVLMPMRTN